MSRRSVADRLGDRVRDASSDAVRVALFPTTVHDANRLVHQPLNAVLVRGLRNPLRMGIARDQARNLPEFSTPYRFDGTTL